MATTYRHVVTFEGTRPSSRIRNIQTFKRLFDVPSLKPNQMLISGSKPQMQSTDISFGIYKIAVNNQYVYAHNQDQALDVISHINGPGLVKVKREMTDCILADRFGSWRWDLPEREYITLDIEQR